jgi:hypothetical protein
MGNNKLNKFLRIKEREGERWGVGERWRERERERMEKRRVDVCRVSFVIQSKFNFLPLNAISSLAPKLLTKYSFAQTDRKTDGEKF